MTNRVHDQSEMEMSLILFHCCWRSTEKNLRLVDLMLEANQRKTYARWCAPEVPPLQFLHYNLLQAPSFATFRFTLN